MKRNHFLLIAAIFAWVFGLAMMLVPEKMLGNLTTETNSTVNLVMQWVGVGLFSIGCINFLSRNDIGSEALRAVMIGNIILHVIGLGFDFYDYSNGFMNVSGLGSGLVVHLLMIIGFGYYLVKIQKVKV